MKGFSTLELIIAMAVISMTLGALVLLTFASSSLGVSSEEHRDALSLAESLLAQTNGNAQKDFNLVVPTTTIDTIGARAYTEVLSVQLERDFLTKAISATVSWQDARDRTQSVTLSTFITNALHATGGNTCDSVLAGDWSHPRIANAVQSFGSLVGDTVSAYTITGIDAYHGYLYVTASNSAVAKETFFVFSTAGNNLALVAKLDNDMSTNTGLAGIAIASSSAGTYAFVASASSFARGQLQIVNISNPAQPRVQLTYKIPTAVVPTAGLGNAIFYKDGYVYLGLTKTSGAGKEFNIIDVHNPAAPAWVGGYQVGNDVNAIYANGSYAYVASPNGQNVIALSVKNPTNPALAGTFTGAGGANGERLATVGDTLYVGRTFGTNEFYLLNAADPTHLSALGAYDLGTGSGTSIYGIVVRDYLAFLLTNAGLMVYNIANPANAFLYAPTLALPSASKGVALDCEGNVLYAASNDTTGHGFLSVITSQ